MRASQASDDALQEDQVAPQTQVLCISQVITVTIDAVNGNDMVANEHMRHGMLDVILFVVGAVPPGKEVQDIARDGCRTMLEMSNTASSSMTP